MGGRQAFAPLYARYADPVYRYSYRRLGNPEAAADATSQTFAQAVTALPRYQAGSFRAWLFSIAANVVADAYRRQRPTASLETASVEVTLIDGSPSPEEEALAAEEQRSVTALLAHLTPDQRRIVQLRLAGLSGVEIASVLGLSVTAVRSSQFRAYARLRRLMGKQGGREERRDDR